MTLERPSTPESPDPSTPLHALALDLTALVSSLEGVEHVYDARPVAEAVIGSVVNTVVRRESAPVAVGERAGVMTVRVRIAAASDRPASATCRAVFDSVHDRIAATLGPDMAVEVDVEVGRIG